MINTDKLNRTLTINLVEVTSTTKVYPTVTGLKWGVAETIEIDVAGPNPPTALVTVKTLNNQQVSTATFERPIWEYEIVENKLSFPITPITGNLGNQTFMVECRFYMGQTAEPIIGKIYVEVIDDRFALTADKTELNEDGEVTFNLTANGIQDGTVYKLVLRGNAVKSTDFLYNNKVNTLTSFPLTVQGGKASFTLKANPDKTTEGDEKFFVEIRDTSAMSRLLAVSDAITLKDTSKQVTYKITPDKLVVNEGDTVTYEVTANVPDGTVLAWKALLNPTLTQKDFLLDTSGIGTITDGKFTFSLTLTKDKYTERVEQIIVEVYNNINMAKTFLVAKAPAVVITDTSKSPSYAIAVSKSVINENDELVVTLKTTGFDDGTVFYWGITSRYNDSTITEADFEEGLTGEVTITGDKGEIKLHTKADIAAEGVEYFLVKIYPDIDMLNAVVSTQVVKIEDSSAPPASCTITTNSEIYNEGQQVIFNFATQNIPDKAYVYWKIQGTGIARQDFNDSLTGKSTVYNNAATFYRLISADSYTEGEEFFSIIAYSDEKMSKVIGESAPVKIADTSQSFKFVAKVNTFNEGGVLGIGLEGRNVKVSTATYDSRVFWEIVGVSGTVDVNDFTATSGSIQMVNSTFARTLGIHALNDLKTESDETFKIVLYADADKTKPIIESEVFTLKDTSKNTTMTVTTDKVELNEGDNISITITGEGLENIGDPIADPDVPGKYTVTVVLEIYPEIIGEVRSNITRFDSDIHPIVKLVCSNITEYNSAAKAPLKGSVTLTANIRADKSTEGTEKFRILIFKPSADVVARSEIITINDTSVNSAASSTVDLGELRCNTALPYGFIKTSNSEYPCSYQTTWDKTLINSGSELTIRHNRGHNQLQAEARLLFVYKVGAGDNINYLLRLFSIVSGARDSGYFTSYPSGAPTDVNGYHDIKLKVRSNIGKYEGVYGFEILYVPAADAVVGSYTAVKPVYAEGLTFKGSLFNSSYSQVSLDTSGKTGAFIFI